MQVSKPILIVDDDRNFLQSFSNMLVYKNYKVTSAASPTEALKAYSEKEFSCVFMDVRMPGIDGLELLDSFLKLQKQTPIIMISGQGNISTAVQSIKLGAFDFIEKPIDIDRIFRVMDHALNSSTNQFEKINLTHKNQMRLVYRSQAIHDLLGIISKVAPTKAKILILGETGVGKDLVAHEIHQRSNRKSHPFIKINCASIPSELLESELFGHKKGSFTNAIRDYKGKFHLADKGTIFLDEIGDLDLELQAKLLRVLQEGEINVIGSESTFKIDVRVICATNKDLPSLVKSGNFREDLFHRLNVVSVFVPSLKDRKEDISPLVDYFLEKFSKEYNRNLTGISPMGLRELLKYDWPGNIRELQNVVEKIVIFSESSEITANEVINMIINDNRQEKKQTEQLNLRKSLEDFEKEAIYSALISEKWKMGNVAELLGIDRTTLFKKIKKYNLVEEK